MIKLNRTTEYGLIAVRHMSRKQQGDPDSVTSAREISDHYGLPFEITAKTLQRLKDTGLILSAQGARGGYTLQKALHEISLAEFVHLMEGPQGVVPCTPAGELHTECGCEYHPRCEIRGIMSRLNSRVNQFLSGIHLNELDEVFQLEGLKS